MALLEANVLLAVGLFGVGQEYILSGLFCEVSVLTCSPHRQLITFLAIPFLHTVPQFKPHTPLILLSFSAVAKLPFLAFCSLPSHFGVSFLFGLVSLLLFLFPLSQSTMAFPASPKEAAFVSRGLMDCSMNVMENDQFLSQYSIHALKFKELLELLSDADMPPARKNYLWAIG